MTTNTSKANQRNKELEKWYREKFNLRIEKNKLLKVGAKYWKDFTLEEKEAIQRVRRFGFEKYCRVVWSEAIPTDWY